METFPWNSHWIHHGPIQAIEKADIWPFWIPITLLVSCAIIVIIRFIHPGYYHALYEASLRNINIDLYVREDFSNSNLSGLLLHFNFLLMLSTLLLIAFSNYLIPHATDHEFPFYSLSMIFLALSIHMVYRYLMLGMVRVLSEVGRGIISSIYNFKLSIELGGVLLTILLIAHFAIQFEARYFLIILLVILLIINILYWVWSIQHAIRNGLHWFYLFLYLCTLEILPLVVIFLVFSDKI